mmetsp:Transcript_12689/g.29475  ORF Transcript_12689/g.29475 Transcript_12689/m.29475 type:complete len:93 (+) Transcript_12689:279-557(+)
MILLSRNHNPNQQWLQKLPGVARKLEVSLYRSAPSREQYSDESTLTQRVQKFALEVFAQCNAGHGKIQSILAMKQSPDQRLDVTRSKRKGML